MCVAFCPSGTLLASCAENIRLWDVVSSLMHQSYTMSWTNRKYDSVWPCRVLERVCKWLKVTRGTSQALDSPVTELNLCLVRESQLHLCSLVTFQLNSQIRILNLILQAVETTQLKCGIWRMIWLAKRGHQRTLPLRTWFPNGRRRMWLIGWQKLGWVTLAIYLNPKASPELSSSILMTRSWQGTSESAREKLIHSSMYWKWDEINVYEWVLFQRKRILGSNSWLSSNGSNPWGWVPNDAFHDQTQLPSRRSFSAPLPMTSSRNPWFVQVSHYESILTIGLFVRGWIFRWKHVWAGRNQGLVPHGPHHQSPHQCWAGQHDADPQLWASKQDFRILGTATQHVVNSFDAEMDFRPFGRKCNLWPSGTQTASTVQSGHLLICDSQIVIKFPPTTSAASHHGLTAVVGFRILLG